MFCMFYHTSIPYHLPTNNYEQILKAVAWCPAVTKQFVTKVMNTF